MRTRRVVMVALVALLACAHVHARTLDQVPSYLKKEGNFVSYPAIAMAGLGMLVGGAVALPASLIAAPIGWAAGDPLGYALVPMSLLATGGGEVGYHVGGAIPWAVKNTFYDAPMAGIARIKGEPASGLVAQVEPPSVNPVDFQYLDTTPPDARIPVVLSRQFSSALPPPKEPTSLMLRRQLSPFKAPALPASRQPTTAPRVIAPAPSAVVTPAVTAPAALSRVEQPAITGQPVAPNTALAPPILPPPPPVQAAPVTQAVPVIVPPPPVATAPTDSPPPVDAPRGVMERTADEPSGGTESFDAGDAGDEESSRPALRKKKRKFSERFSF